MSQNLLQGLMADFSAAQAPKYAPVCFFGEPERVCAVLEELRLRYEQANPGRKAVLIYGDEFAEAVLHALIDGSMAAVQSRLRQTDLLLFCEVEKIAGRTAAEWEFYSLCDYLMERGRRIAFGTSQPPANLTCLAGRVRTQLEGSTVCPVDD